ncbi:MAG: HlyD family type I secretion periplasmic adaptor subunit [Alsobacter sp.]
MRAQDLFYRFDDFLAARAREGRVHVDRLMAWTRSGEDGIRSSLVATFLGSAALVFGLGGWAAVTPLAGAAVAPATVVVDSSVKKVQHQTGGIVGEIRVKDGDRVYAGDVVMRLDETVTRANLQIAAKQLDQFAARESRLVAERDGVDHLIIPATLQARLSDPEIASMIGDEQRLFDSRRAAREGLRAQLAERIQQLNDEVTGLQAQLSAKEKETSFIREELKAVRDLYRKNLVPITRVNALERDATRIEGEQGQLQASVAQTRGKISEIRLQILQIDQDLRTEVGKDLREQQAKQAELVERRVAAEDALRRVEIRSPQTGVVHQLSVHTVGGVVAPGEPIMLVVPEGDVLVLEAKITPQDIDHVHVGQSAIIRLSAFNTRTTPEISGEVIFVSADISKDPQPQLPPYYLARIKPSAEDLKRLSQLKLLPGMPAEVHLQTGERSALSYMLKPLTEQMSRAFKED